MILCACLQLLYKLIQLSFHYNKRLFFNILKYFNVNTNISTDAKFSNILSKEFFQVASNCCLEISLKNFFFRFCLCLLLYITKVQVFESKILRHYFAIFDKAFDRPNVGWFRLAGFG